VELAERDEALTALADMIDRAVAGTGRIAVVGGAVAVGKSALLDAFTGQVADAGGTALTAIASDSESDIPLGVVAQMVLGAGLSAQEYERIDGLITRCAAALSPVDGPRRTRLSGSDALFVHALCRALLDLADRRLLALVVDDVHHADTASLACLSYLAPRLRKARAVAVFGQSDRPTQQSPDFRVELLRQPHSRSIVLRPLTRAGVGAMVATRLGAHEAERIAAECFELTGGNPLLLSGLLDDHHAALRAAAPLEPPPLDIADGYARAVLSCLRRGWTPMTETAQALAVLGKPDTVHRLLRLDADSVGQALRALKSSGLLDAGRFRHAKARDAVLLDLTPERRHRLHREAAELAYTDGRPATAVAEHLLAANGSEAPWAVSVLTSAARESLADGQVASAVDYLKLACDTCADESERARIKTTLVRAEWRVNPSLPEHHMSDLLDALYEGYLHGTDAVVLAKALLWHGRFDAARDVLTHLGASPAGFDAETAAELRTTRPWLRCSYTPFADYVPLDDTDEDGRPLVPTATEDKRRFDAAALLDTVLTMGPSAQVVAEAERILRSSRLDGMGMDAVESALLALTYAERPHSAAPWCDELMDEARTRQAPSRQARLAAIRSEISIRQGDLRGAERHARESLEILPASGWGVAVGTSLASLLTALTAMGRHAEAAQTLSLPVPEAMLQSRFGLHYVRARGQYNLATGDYDGALADFEACGALMGRWNLDVPGLIAWRNDAAEALVRMGRRDQARKLIEEQLGLCRQRTSPRTYGCSLRILAMTQNPRQQPVLLRQAIDILQASGDRHELARALTDLAMAYHALGQPQRARVIGRQAWTIALECGAEPLSRQLSADSGRPEPGPEAPASLLTHAEKRVADLVALGYANREIAKRLFITVSTVEQHLTHIYRKFGVPGRAELAAVLSAGPRPDPVSAWPEDGPLVEKA
jgi:DNA-binding CsgD family transcriptional regulator